MATTTNIQVLLKYYATRQNNAMVNVLDFCEYMRRYAQHHIEEQPDLVQYLANTQEVVKKELDKLVESNQIVMTQAEPDKQQVCVIGYYVDKFAVRYQDIKKNTAIPFPSHTYLPKNIPQEVYKKESAENFFSDMLASQDLNQRFLYCLQLPRGLPTILFPSNVPVLTLLEISLSKLQSKLQKEEFHDYFLKKLKIANPGKELSIKNFFTAVVKKPEAALSSIKDSAESFYQWSQLCFFIKQDYEKTKDLTQEDIALLQSICIIEFCTAFYRTKAQQDLQRSTALKNLDLVLTKPPYYFTREAIDSFTDSRGIPLLGQYSLEDLNEYMHKLTTEAEDNKLPKLLTFKTPNNVRYYITKGKVLPLILRLCSDARETARDIVTKECHAALKRFEPVPEFKNQDLFEKKLEKIVENTSPLLYTLLNVSFLHAVYYEMRTNGETTPEVMQLFHDGQIPPYSELLMISKDEILTDAKIMLPVWYTIPIVSWFLSLFLGPPKTKKKKDSQEKKTKSYDNSEKEEPDFISPAEKRDPSLSRKNELKQAAVEAEKYFVPANSTLERELSSYEQIWNKMLNKQVRLDLTDDVNSLIRDYVRKIIKTLRASNFTPERIKNLAETLVKTPNMQKIKDHDELCMYVQLYMVKLIKNL
ncbi:MAG: hypothetical protein J6B81_03860 [Spirochaetaceae bacterium]|nr:hypothetical protein [Spirochaetaceae bacterium]